MPGDPLRAKFIAETYLTHAVCVNKVRNMLAYTGLYNGKEVSVMGAGMGIPSMGIYSYELYHFYNVDQIIRIGSAGAIQDDIALNDLVIAMGACTDSNYGYQFGLQGSFAPLADFTLLEKAVCSARTRNLTVQTGNVLSSDMFYNDMENINAPWRKMGILAVDMETAGLYMNAARAGKKALCLLTISDHLYKKEYLNAEERQLGFSNMIELALSLL